MKRLLCSITALVLVSSSLTGCGAPKPKESAQSTTASTKTEVKPIEFSIFMDKAGKNFDSSETPVGKKFKEKTGVSFKAEYAVGEKGQRLGLIIASGEYPDIIVSSPSTLIAADAIIPLDEYIEKYGPNIKKLYSEDVLKRAKWSKEHPNIYSFPTGQYKQERWEPNLSFALQHAVVKELGYPKMNTVKDFENAIKQYKDKYPSIDGKPTIGLSLSGDGTRFLITVTNPGFHVTGAPDDGDWYIDQKTLTAQLHITRPEEKEYFRWLNHMNNVGLLDSESFIQKNDQYQAKISSGRVLGLIDAGWSYGGAEKALRQAGKDEKTYGRYCISLDTKYKNADFWPSLKTSAGTGVTITKKCKNPERLVQFIDYLCSEEGQILKNWGIEGEHYKIENGKRVIPEDIKNQMLTDKEFGFRTGINIFQDFPTRSDGEKDSKGQNYTTKTKEEIIEGYSPIEKEVLSKYNAKMWMDLFPPASEFPVRKYGSGSNMQSFVAQDSNDKVLIQKCSEVVKKGIVRAVIASPDQFDAAWDSMLKELDSVGLKKLTENYNRVLKEMMEFWK